MQATTLRFLMVQFLTEFGQSLFELFGFLLPGEPGGFGGPAIGRRTDPQSLVQGDRGFGELARGVLEVDVVERFENRCIDFAEKIIAAVNLAGIVQALDLERVMRGRIPREPKAVRTADNVSVPGMERSGRKNAGRGLLGGRTKQQIANQLSDRIPILVGGIEEHIQPLVHSINLHPLAGLRAVDGQVRQLHCL